MTYEDFPVAAEKYQQIQKLQRVVDGLNGSVKVAVYPQGSSVDIFHANAVPESDDSGEQKAEQFRRTLTESYTAEINKLKEDIAKL